MSNITKARAQIEESLNYALSNATFIGRGLPWWKYAAMGLWLLMDLTAAIRDFSDKWAKDARAFAELVSEDDDK